MDKLGTYALVAALQEISRKAAPVTDHERWISLRSCMTTAQRPSLDPPEPAVPATAAVQPVAPQPATLSTARPRRTFRYLQQIDLRHHQVRQQAGL